MTFVEIVDWDAARSVVLFVFLSGDGTMRNSPNT